MNKLRLKYGLYWNGKYPNLVKESLVVVCFILAYGLAAYIDELGDREAQMANYWSGQLADCLDGRWRGRTESGTQIGCMPAVTFEQHERTSK